MAGNKTIKDLLVEEIKDLYSAEKQLTKALPKMARGASDTTLKTALVDHLHETQEQVVRLEQAGQLLGIKVAGKKCAGMEGVIQEGAEVLQRQGDESILDLGIIGAGSRVEHYEMAAYQTAISLAQRIQATEIVDLLNESLSEEEAADKKLRQIGSELMEKAPAENESKRTSASSSTL
jgi:ferritin-like metal-binding protein YciE